MRQPDEFQKQSEPPAPPLGLESGQTQVSTNLDVSGADPSAFDEAGDDLWDKRLHVLEEVGRGGMGAILRATDVKLQRELALKVTPKPRPEMPSPVLARFIEEAQITAQLEHPNIVPVHDLGLDPGGRAYFSMKLVRGQSLADILEKRRAGDPLTLAEFGLRRLLDIFLQVCQATEYAHARGVIHRDLKPANVMVGGFGEVLVMDWGVAKVVTQPEHDVPSPESGDATVEQIQSLRAGRAVWATQHGELVGTLTYMSPEQAQGLAVDERSDLYALGVILYEILCDRVPFDDEQPVVVLGLLLTQEPRRPSEINRAAPLALETLALRLLEKDPARRVTIPQIRAHVQNYIEGIGRDYQRESLRSGIGWALGAVLLFAFLVWYVTGESVATVLALGPPAVLSTLGWFLVVIAFGYPLWSIYVALRQSRIQPDRFQPANSLQIFVSGYMAQRTFAASVAPLSQLVFIIELITVTAFRISRGAFRPAAFVQQLSNQMHAQWTQALVVMAIFSFVYLFLLSTEVRFARRVERYEVLVIRRPWESIWPFFVSVILLLSVVITDALDWFLSSQTPTLVHFLHERVMMPPLSVFDMFKTLVFQGTFLLGLVVTLSITFPFAEVVASLRMAHELADEARVNSRSRYFLRSLAVFRVIRTNFLYAGALIGTLTAITIVSESGEQPLVQNVVYVLGPSLIGFLGYWVTRRYVHAYLKLAPAVRRMVDSELDRSRRAQWRANLRELEAAPLRWRLFALSVPVVCVLSYLLWTGSGIHRQAIAQLIMPVTAEGWLLILPYLLLVPILLAQQRVQSYRLRRRLRDRSHSDAPN